MKARAGLKLLQRPELVEASLWRRLSDSGDGQCRTALFDRYAPFARALSRQEFRRRPAYGLERADFEQLAFSGLLEAIDKFDPLRGTPFSAFARHRIRGAIADGLTRSSEGAAQFTARRRAEVERLKSLLPNRDGGANPIDDLAALASALAIGFMAENARSSPAHSRDDPYENVAWRELQLRVLEEIEHLPVGERTVMQQHYVNEAPFTVIAKLLGLSKGRVAQLHRAALTRLRARLRQMEQRA